jgi:AraC-like DNA-binding protein
MKQQNPILKFINGGAVYIGKGVSTKTHRHHAIQLTISFKQTFEIKTPKRTLENCRFVIIPENVPHQFICSSEDYQVFIYLDPFNKLSQLLKNKFALKSNIVITNNLLHKVPPLMEWLIMERDGMEALITKFIELITDCTIPYPNKDIRITKSIEYLTKNLDKAIKISEVANFVCLSESRFAHLFKLQVGIPFRRYILWLRIQKTLLSFLTGNSFTDACYDGGFSDLPHFNRTFKEMFGNTPSAILKR